MNQCPEGKCITILITKENYSLDIPIRGTFGFLNLKWETNFFYVNHLTVEQSKIDEFIKQYFIPLEYCIKCGKKNDTSRYNKLSKEVECKDNDKFCAVATKHNQGLGSLMVLKKHELFSISNGLYIKWKEGTVDSIDEKLFFLIKPFKYCFNCGRPTNIDKHFLDEKSKLYKKILLKKEIQNRF